jgi:hypothetical protein
MSISGGKKRLLMDKEPDYVFSVGPYNYSVFFDAEEILRKSVDRGEDLYGLTEHHLQEINVFPEMADDVKAETTFHEVFHCCFFAAGLGSRVSDEEEENIISAISPILLDTLRRNPDLVKLLLD